MPIQGASRSRIFIRHGVKSFPVITCSGFWDYRSFESICMRPITIAVGRASQTQDWGRVRGQDRLLHNALKKTAYVCSTACFVRRPVMFKTLVIPCMTLLPVNSMLPL